MNDASLLADCRYLEMTLAECEELTVWLVQASDMHSWASWHPGQDFRVPLQANVGRERASGKLMLLSG